MLTRLDAIALSLLWTEQAAHKPARQREAPPRAGVLPAGLRLCDAATLEEVVDGLEGAPDLAASLRSRADAAMLAADRAGLGLVAFGDPAYPALLAQIPDPPPALWVAGALPPTDATVAIVGSRNATPHALQVASQLGEDLARAGLCVVSGLARGVDGAAHRGALRAGGSTIAVLGCGVDVIYPPEHATLSREITARGAIVSEFPPGTPPRGWHFPRRNRIISGLCHGVVVVEASDHSGSLITARCALAQGREVMAVPGGVLSGRNRGAHGLLRDGAAVIEGVEDVLEELHYTGQRAADGEDTTKLKAPEAWLRSMAAAESYNLEALCALAGLDAVPMLARLSRLELAGWIVRDRGGRFVKAGGNVLR
jgi:DNA processing protein